MKIREYIKTLFELAPKSAKIVIWYSTIGRRWQSLNIASRARIIAWKLIRIKFFLWFQHFKVISSEKLRLLAAIYARKSERQQLGEIEDFPSGFADAWINTQFCNPITTPHLTTRWYCQHCVKEIKTFFSAHLTAGGGVWECSQIVRQSKSYTLCFVGGVGLLRNEIIKLYIQSWILCRATTTFSLVQTLLVNWLTSRPPSWRIQCAERHVLSISGKEDCSVSKIGLNFECFKSYSAWRLVVSIVKFSQIIFHLSLSFAARTRWSFLLLFSRENSRRSALFSFD